VVRLSTQSPESGRRRNYGSRRVQFQLLVLVFSLMTIVLMMGKAAQPATWSWLFAGQPGNAESIPAGEQPAAAEESNIDTRAVGTPRQPQPPGVVVIKKSLDNASKEQGGQQETRSPLGIELSRYESVVDDTVFRSQESQLWFETLAALRDAPEDLVARRAIPLVGFTQLFRQPDQYRGRLVEVQGTVRRAHRIVSHPNDFQIEGYWRCWLFPDGTTNPIVIYALEMPDSFPSGMSTRERVNFRGVFFKRWVYAADGGGMVAPLVLARAVEWHPQQTVNPPSSFPSLPIILVVLAIVAVVAVVLARLAFQSSHPDKSAAAYRDSSEAAATSRQTLSSIESLDVRDPDEVARADLLRMEMEMEMEMEKAFRSPPPATRGEQ